MSRWVLSLSVALLLALFGGDRSSGATYASVAAARCVCVLGATLEGGWERDSNGVPSAVESAEGTLEETEERSDPSEGCQDSHCPAVDPRRRWFDAADGVVGLPASQGPAQLFRRRCERRRTPVRGPPSAGVRLG